MSGRGRILPGIDPRVGHVVPSRHPRQHQADQDDPFVLGLLAEAHDRLGHADEAREYYEEVLQSSSHGITSAFARPRARQYLEAAR